MGSKPCFLQQSNGNVACRFIERLRFLSLRWVTRCLQDVHNAICWQADRCTGRCIGRFQRRNCCSSAGGSGRLAAQLRRTGHGSADCAGPDPVLRRGAAVRVGARRQRLCTAVREGGRRSRSCPCMCWLVSASRALTYTLYCECIRRRKMPPRISQEQRSKVALPMSRCA